MKPFEGRFDLNETFFKYFITYDRLTYMTHHAFYGKTDADRANMFIDLGGFIRSIIMRIMDYGYKNSSTCIAAAAINLVAHIRGFYRSRYHTELKFYIVFGTQNPKNRVQADYNAHYIQAYNVNTIMQSIIKENLDILKLLCRYIPDVYMIDGGDEDPGVIIQTLINNPDKAKMYIGKGIPNIIYTNDIFNFQLVLNPATFIFRPRKRFINGTDGRIDESYVVNKSLLYQSYKFAKGLTVNDEDMKRNMDISYFPILLALNGLKERHVPSILQYNRAIDLIKTLNDKGYLRYDMNPTVMLSIVSTHLPELFLKARRGENFNINLLDNYLTLNIPTNALNISDPQIFAEIVDLVNPQDVQEINNKYFVEYPLDLMNL